MLCEAALRTEPSYIRLIGSRSKWLQFRQKLREEGYEESEIKRITSPIGVASDLLVRWEKANTET